MLPSKILKIMSNGKGRSRSTTDNAATEWRQIRAGRVGDPEAASQLGSLSSLLEKATPAALLEEIDFLQHPLFLLYGELLESHGELLVFYGEDPCG